MEYQIQPQIINKSVKRIFQKNDKCSLVWEVNMDIDWNGTKYRNTKGILIDPARKGTQVDIGLSDGGQVSLQLEEDTKLIKMTKGARTINVKTM